MALNAKNKFGFVDGTLKKPINDAAATQLWERCNDMHYGETGHSKPSCYRLIGFPTHWNQNRNTPRNDTNRKPVAHQVSASPTDASTENVIPSLTSA
ncbi:hypothetical protein U1Q18_043813 [Sarracenia purpurea var. burkii]